jgi:hypothetical protein
MITALSSLAIVFTVLGTVYAIGKAADDSTKPEVRAQLATWLKAKNLATDHTSTIHGILVQTLNTFFDSNPFSRKFFVRSLIFSVAGSVTVLILTYLLLQISGDTHANSMASKVLAHGPSFLSAWMWLSTASAVFDYISLAKSILFINSMTFRAAPIRHYVLDLSLSFSLSLGVVLFLLASFWILGYPQKSEEDFGRSPELFILFAAITLIIPTKFVLVISAATVFAKLVLWISKPLQRLKADVLDVDGKPFTTVALLSWPFFLILCLWLIMLTS